MKNFIFNFFLFISDKSLFFAAENNNTGLKKMMIIFLSLKMFNINNKEKYHKNY